MTVLFRPFGANGVYGVRRFGTFGERCVIARPAAPPLGRPG